MRPGGDKHLLNLSNDDARPSRATIVGSTRDPRSDAHACPYARESGFARELSCVRRRAHHILNVSRRDLQVSVTGTVPSWRATRPTPPASRERRRPDRGGSTGHAGLGQDDGRWQQVAFQATALGPPPPPPPADDYVDGGGLLVGSRVRTRREPLVSRRLEGKIALISGTARGQGRAAASRFVRGGDG